MGQIGNCRVQSNSRTQGAPGSPRADRGSRGTLGGAQRRSSWQACSCPGVPSSRPTLRAGTTAIVLPDLPAVAMRGSVLRTSGRSARSVAPPRTVRWEKLVLRTQPVSLETAPFRAAWVVGGAMFPRDAGPASRTIRPRAGPRVGPALRQQVADPRFERRGATSPPSGRAVASSSTMAGSFETRLRHCACRQCGCHGGARSQPCYLRRLHAVAPLLCGEA